MAPGRPPPPGDRPPSPARLLAERGLRAKKRLGQCFLHDRRVVARIVEAAGVGPDHAGPVVEIGAGLGVLTEALAARAPRLLAIERDPDMLAYLRERFADAPRVEIVAADALTYDFAGLAPGATVVGNLPYNIASPLLFRLLDARASVRRVVVMLQKEMARRIAAPPGGKLYGAPSVVCQALARVTPCLDVGRGAFTPAPRVDSAVIRLDLHDAPPPPAGRPIFRETVRAAFATRRKTLRRALGRAFGDARARAALGAAGVDPVRRAETLSPGEFLRLAAALEAAPPPPGGGA